jgi:hypothetical protein
MAVKKPLVKTAGPEVISVKSGLWPPLSSSLYLVQKPHKRLCSWLETKAIKKRQANATKEVPGGERGKGGEDVGKA